MSLGGIRADLSVSVEPVLAVSESAVSISVLTDVSFPFRIANLMCVTSYHISCMG